MERKSLVPLAEGVCNIVGKTTAAVREQGRVADGKKYKGIFGPPEEALAEARRIADKNAPNHIISSKEVIQQDEKDLGR